jgi:hypothetical protein
MASLRTAATVGEGQSIVKVFNISTCVTGDTIAVPPNHGFLVVNKTTTDATSASYSSATGLVTITVANTPDVAVWILL